MSRKTVRAVICVLLAIMMIVGLLAAFVPAGLSVPAKAVTQSEIDNLKAQQDAIKAQQQQQAQNIQNLRDQQADVMSQKEALDQQCALLMHGARNNVRAGQRIGLSCKSRQHRGRCRTGPVFKRRGCPCRQKKSLELCVKNRS